MVCRVRMLQAPEGRRGIDIESSIARAGKAASAGARLKRLPLRRSASQKGGPNKQGIPD